MRPGYQILGYATLDACVRMNAVDVPGWYRVMTEGPGVFTIWVPALWPYAVTVGLAEWFDVRTMPIRDICSRTTCVPW